MRSRQTKLWVDQHHDTETVWAAMSDNHRRQIARWYAKAIEKAARVRVHDNAADDREQRDDISK